MAVERIIHCDNLDCRVHAQTATPPPYLPLGFLLVQEGLSDTRAEHHFCGWECVLKYAAKFEPPTVIEL